MFIKTIDTGEVLRLTDYTNVERTREVNGGFNLSFTLFKTDKNQHAYDFVDNENIIIYAGVEYVIKRLGKRIIKKKTVKIVDCELKAINDLMDEWQYKLISGSLQITTAMGHALEPTGFTFSIHGEFDSVSFENFGDANPMELVGKIIDRYQAEVIITANHVALYNQIGADTNSQFRYRHNIGTISLESDTNGFATVIKGFGADGLEVEYESPLAAIYGRRHAKPVRDDRFTNPETLTEECKARLNDQFSISIEIDYVEVKKNGINVNGFDLGDRLYLIHGEFGLKNRVRVLAITDYPESNKQPKLKISNITKDARDMLASFNATKQTVDRATDENGQIVNTALSADAQYTIDAVNRTFNQVDYTETRGLVVTDPVNFMRLLAFKKGGLYGSIDGASLDIFINADGVNLAYVWGLLAEEYVSIGPGTTFAEGYDPSQLATAGHTHAFADITDKPLTYPPEAHNHDTEYEQLTVEAIQTPTLTNNWAIYAIDWSQPGFYEDRGRIYLQGTIGGGSLGTAAFTLPTGYRPSHNMSQGGIDIMTDGQIIIQNGDVAKISLDGISFRI
jgi:phage minor structural protein